MLCGASVDSGTSMEELRHGIQMCRLIASLLPRLEAPEDGGRVPGCSSPVSGPSHSDQVGVGSGLATSLLPWEVGGVECWGGRPDMDDGLLLCAAHGLSCEYASPSTAYL